MKAALVLLLIPLAGCIAMPEPVATGIPQEELDALYNQTTQATFAMRELVDNHVLMQIVPAAPVEARIEGALPQHGGTSVQGQGDDGTPRPCMSFYSPGFRSVSFGALRHPTVITDVDGQGVSAQVPSYDGVYSNDLEAALESWDTGYPLTVAFGVNEAAAWKGSDLRLVLTSAKPFHFRTLPGGSFDCLTHVADLDGDVSVDLGLATVVREKSHAFQTDGRTISTIYVGGTGDYAGHMEGPDQFYKEYVGQSGYSFSSSVLDPGDYRLHIQQMVLVQDPAATATFPSGVVVMQHHLPAWALLPPWEIPDV